MDVTEYGLEALNRALQQKEFSSAEYVERLIARVESARALNAYVTFNPQQLREAARVADARLALGERAPLLGVPIALKDNINTADLPTSVGTGALRGRTPAGDALIVQRLRDAGALVAGKAGMHELAFGITSNNAVTGAVHNPWDARCIAGGSSGGSAAVVAAALAPAAVGTDTGASVRLPAALCGVVGLRPTVGRVPGQGIAPISSTRDTAGPITRDVADAILLDGLLCSDASPVPEVSLSGLRLGLPKARFWSGLEDEVRAVMDERLQQLRRAGVAFVDVDLDGLDELNDAVGFPVALYEFMAEMPQYLREAGHAVDIAQLIAGIGSPDVAQVLKPLLEGGAIPEAVYRDAMAARGKLQRLYAEAFARHGVQGLVFPTSPLTARPLGQDESVELHGQQLPTFPAFIRNTDPGSNAGIPGISLPAGLATNGLPVGLEIDAPADADKQLLGIARAIERALPPATLPLLD